MPTERKPAGEPRKERRTARKRAERGAHGRNAAGPEGARPAQWKHPPDNPKWSKGGGGT